MKSLLLVDDDANHALRLAARLIAAGHDVCQNNDASLALANARRCIPDVFILDIDLPGDTALTMATLLRAIPQLGQIPVIFVTAQEKDGMRERARKAGAVALLDASQFASKLVSLVDHVCQTTSLSTQGAAA